jgi:hypothetical protein
MIGTSCRKVRQAPDNTAFFRLRNQAVKTKKEDKVKIAALYERLSSGGEGRDGDGNSIKDQKIAA